MDCCRAEALDAEFGKKVAAIDLRKYRNRGPSKTTRLLLNALREQGVADRTLLDIGGGVGAISHELLRSGLAHATSVDAAGAYIEAARSEAERQGHLNRLNLRNGDFVMIADEIPAADIVTLDRVICCYPDMPALVGMTVERRDELLNGAGARGYLWLDKRGYPDSEAAMWQIGLTVDGRARLVSARAGGKEYGETNGKQTAKRSIRAWQ